MSCCGEPAIINGIYKPLGQRLLDYGREAYGDYMSTGRTILWIYTFYDAESECETCRTGLDVMYAWFHRYNLFTNVSRSVKIVVEPEPEKNLICGEMGWNKLPMNIFADEKGRIFDILFEFPDDAWLDKYILPFIQKDGSL